MFSLEWGVPRILLKRYTVKGPQFEEAETETVRNHAVKQGWLAPGAQQPSQVAPFSQQWIQAGSAASFAAWRGDRKC